MGRTPLVLNPNAPLVTATRVLASNIDATTATAKRDARLVQVADPTELPNWVLALAVVVMACVVFSPVIAKVVA